MTASRLLALFNQVADTPEAIPPLRRFVLDLAVRGRLVPQDPDDEPAETLLHRIAAEKARLIKAGVTRKPRAPANGENPEPGFDIPASWRRWRS
ncbi:MAG: type I restriction endonuclease subunit M [Rhodobacteraceae bacterium]|nr:type I restriction endonuclease subunit M [Paracoccaceae bacterium]